MNHDEDDDRPVARPRRKDRRSLSTWAWVGIATGISVLLLGLFGGIVVLSMRATESRRAAYPPPAPESVKPKVWKEEELSAAVKGMSAAEVKELLGKPYYTSNDPEVRLDGAYFKYPDLLIDPHAGKMIWAEIHFKNRIATGRVR